MPFKKIPNNYLFKYLTTGTWFLGCTYKFSYLSKSPKFMFCFEIPLFCDTKMCEFKTSTENSVKPTFLHLHLNSCRIIYNNLKIFLSLTFEWMFVSIQQFYFWILLWIFSSKIPHCTKGLERNELYFANSTFLAVFNLLPPPNHCGIEQHSTFPLATFIKNFTIACCKSWHVVEFQFRG